MAQYPVRNPRNGEIDYHFNLLSAQEVSAQCQRLKSGQAEWANLHIDQRIEILQAWKNAYIKRKEPLMNALMDDTGRKWETVLEADLVDKSIDRWCTIAKDFFSQKTIRTASIPFIDIHQDLVPYPLVGVISPWNFPLLLSLIDTIPALLAGSAVIVKPSEITPRFIAHMQASIQDVPELAKIFHYIPGDGKVGAALLPEIDLVCFTGSVATGKKIYQSAATHFIPAFLELGGKDPAIVFEGADLEAASASILWAATANCGQSCLSIERIYVQENIFDAFLEKIIEKAKALHLAYPTVENGNVGPVIAERQATIIDKHLKDAIDKGAILHSGSGHCENINGGLWCRPTILTDVDHNMKVMTEETFGPILPIMKFKDKSEALSLANGTSFGLSGAVFAETWEEAYEFGQQLEAGAISINDAGLTALVHEGEKNAFKLSGIGSTRMGPSAIKRFMRQKAFLVKKSSIVSPWWH